MLPLRIAALLLHVYVAWRIAPSLGPPWAAAVFVGVLVVSFVTMPFGLRRQRAEPGHAALGWLSWAGLLSMGLFSSLFVLTFARDLGIGALMLARWATSHAGWPDAVSAGSARAVVVTALLVTVWGFVNARRTASVVRVDVPVPSLPPSLLGFTIAQISDIHVGPTIKRPYLEAIVAAVNGLGADLVAITGDLVDGSVQDLGDDVAALAGLRSREGTFFVTGNHEYYSGAVAWVRELRRLGVTVLLNEHVVVRRGEAALVLAGVTDYGAGHFDRAAASDPRAALAGAPIAALRVLLAHQPRSAEAAEAAGFDLQLSGHTHGGQFWPWNLFVRFQQPFTAGLQRWRNMWVYTSRGTGYWGPPKRFGAPSEITLIRLVAAPATSPRALRGTTGAAPEPGPA